MGPEPGSRRVIAGRYLVQGELGRGGMGRVWRAHDEQLNRPVALKELLLGPGMDEDEQCRLAARARREAQAAAMGSHPGIVTVHDVIEEDGRPWIVMELITGRSLHEVVRTEGAQPARTVAAWGLALLDALAAAHGQGVLHRDVKPENVMIAAGGRVVLTDFGIAGIADAPGATRTVGVVGSPAYLAPERLESRPATAASDLWSLGATLYHAATGVSPFQRDTLPATLYAVGREPPPPARLPKALGVAVEEMLAKDPELRIGEERCRALLEAASREPDSGGEQTSVIGAAPTRVLSGEAPPAPDAASVRRRSMLTWPVVVLVLGVTAVAAAAAVFLLLDPVGGTDSSPASAAPEAGEEGTEPEPSAESPAGQANPVDGGTEAPTGGEPPESGVPGMVQVADPAGFEMLVPEGWQRRVDGAAVFYEPADGGVYLQVDHTPHPTDDEMEHVLRQEEETLDAGRLPGYERLRVADVTAGSGFHSAAEWEFAWGGDGDRRRFLGRNIAVVPGEHVTVGWAASEARWEEYEEWGLAALGSFEPAG